MEYNNFDNLLNQIRNGFGPHIQQSNIKSRIKTLKQTFAECQDLFHSLSGFSWNPITKMFESMNDV